MSSSSVSRRRGGHAEPPRGNYPTLIFAPIGPAEAKPPTRDRSEKGVVEAEPAKNDLSSESDDDDFAIKALRRHGGRIAKSVGNIRDLLQAYENAVSQVLGDTQKSPVSEHSDTPAAIYSPKEMHLIQDPLRWHVSLSPSLWLADYQIKPFLDRLKEATIGSFPVTIPVNGIMTFRSEAPKRRTYIALQVEPSAPLDLALTKIRTVYQTFLDQPDPYGSDFQPHVSFAWVDEADESPTPEKPNGTGQSLSPETLKKIYETAVERQDEIERKTVWISSLKVLVGSVIYTISPS